MAGLNGKVSHRKLGEAVADLVRIVDQHAQVINNQGLRLKAYGEQLADLIEWRRKMDGGEAPPVVRHAEVSEEQPA